MIETHEHAAAPYTEYEVMLIAIANRNKLSETALDCAIGYLLNFAQQARAAFTLPVTIAEYSGLKIHFDHDAGPQ
jgi:hypothetical protein